MTAAALPLRAGARFLASRRRIARPGDPRADQERHFRRLAAALGRAAFWRGQGVEPGLGYDQFRRRVPLRTYEDLSAEVARMIRGEPDVLWPGSCGLYAASSGTTAGPTKYLPVTGPMLAHFRRAGLDSLLYFARRAGSARVFGGRHLFLGGSTAPAAIPGCGAFPALAGDLSGIAARNLPEWAARFLYEPGPAIASMGDWPAKLEAIAERTRSRDIRLVAGIPSWILVLAQVLRQKTGCRTLPELWPHLECLVHGGVPLAPFEDQLRSAFGPTVRFHEVYPASEAFVAAQDGDADQGLRLMADAGVFYEFLPLADYDEARRAELGARAVPLWGVRPGVDYVLILTTPGGLARYLIGDIVAFTSAIPARLRYAGRTRLQLSAFGEHVIEEELTGSLVAVARRRGWRIADFHVAPAFAPADAKGARGLHEWWIEAEGAAGSQASSAASELDAELRRRNEDYDAKRRGGGLDAPVVRLAAPGLFERWLRSEGRWGGQCKTPRCRSDRNIAERLARHAQQAAGDSAQIQPPDTLFGTRGANVSSDPAQAGLG